MRILHVCSELYPILKTGGLADVVAALPAALALCGCDSRLLVPGFPAFMAKISEKKLITTLAPKFGASLIRVFVGLVSENKLCVYIVDAPDLYDRPGNPYADANNQDYADNYLRFALLAWVGCQLADGLDQNWRPQIVHSHDWHAGLTAAYLRAAELRNGQKLAATVITVHNLAYLGIFSGQIFTELDLPCNFFNIDGLEFYGQVSFLKAGLFFSDKLITVSPSYAREIQSAEQGCGLNGLLLKRQHDLFGVLNGVDQNVWNPQSDPCIPNNFTARSMAGKLKCKAALQVQFGLDVKPNVPLFAIVSRLTEQKGLSLVLAGIDEILNRGGQLVVLGTGESELEAGFKAVAASHPLAVAVQIGYDELQAHRIIAGSDVILVPSRFEPCGLTQLYGMLYGTLPLVRNVGGLADTVTDASLENLDAGTASGFVFSEFNLAEFSAALRRAFALYARHADWKLVQKYAMQQNFTWANAAKQYLDIYHQAALA